VIEQFAAIDLPLTLNASSTLWGVSKPDPVFFRRMADELDLSPAEVMYVGDRIDNDILPAQEIGMHAVFIRRGPWGYLHTAWPEMAQVNHRIDSLAEIPDLVQKLNKG
jgi:FMN phosphatase YigB (HAD superfamily)